MDPVEVGIVPPQGWKKADYAADQPQYNVLPSLKSEDGRVVSRWTLTPEERAKVTAGDDIFLTVHTFNQPLQPLLMTVGGAPVEPMSEGEAWAGTSPLHKGEPVRKTDGTLREPHNPPRPPKHKPVG